MSQTPHPHDPFAAESGASAQEPLPEQPEARPASEHLDIDAQDPYAPAPQDPAAQGGAASDPVQHPHDPYAASADGLQADAAPQGAPAGGTVPPRDPYASPAEHASVPPHQAWRPRASRRSGGRCAHPGRPGRSHRRRAPRSDRAPAPDGTDPPR